MQGNVGVFLWRPGPEARTDWPCKLKVEKENPTITLLGETRGQTWKSIQLRALKMSLQSGEAWRDRNAMADSAARTSSEVSGCQQFRSWGPGLATVVRSGLWVKLRRIPNGLTERWWPRQYFKYCCCPI